MYKKFLFASAITLLLLSARLFNKYFSTGVYSHFSWKFWLISIVLLLIAFLPLSSITFKSIGRRLYESVQKFFYFHFINRWFLVSFLLIIATGLFFRLYKLDCFPWGLEGLLYDSAGAVEYALKILDGEPYAPIGWHLGGFLDTLSLYYHALFFLILGPALSTLRYGMVFMGFVNAVLVFFAIKAILDNEHSKSSPNIALMALAGMGLYLFSSVDTVLNYSGFEGTITTPIVMACFLSLNLAFQRNSSFYFCLAGALFGLLLISSKYFITTAPAFIIVILYHAISSLFGWFKSKNDGWYVKIGIFFLGTLFVILPKLLDLFYCYSSYFNRILTVAGADTPAKQQSITNIFNSIVSRLFSVSAFDTFSVMFFCNFSYKYPLSSSNIAIIDKFVIAIFFLGIIYSLARIKSKRYLFLVCYLCFTIALCILTEPYDYRFIPFMPFVYILSSIGLNLIGKLLKYRKIFYILAGIYLVAIVSFNIKNYYMGMGIKPLVIDYHVKNAVLGKYLQNNFLNKNVYVSLGDFGWVIRFLTCNVSEKDINKPTDGMPVRWFSKKCADYTCKKILSNISHIITDNRNTDRDVLFIFDDADCNEEIMSHLETILNKKRNSFNIYSKSCKQDFLFFTVEIKKEELSSINIASVVPQYTGKRYEAQRDIQPEKMVEGLIGKYCSGINCERLEITKVNKNIDFNWHAGSPCPSIKPDYFSVEWNGFVRAEVDEVYWFFTTSDDGIRLWIDEDLIIDNWNPSVSDEICEPVFLEKGLHKIKLQYFESEGVASVSLAWASEHIYKWTVPPDHLFYISEE